MNGDVIVQRIPERQKQKGRIKLHGALSEPNILAPYLPDSGLDKEDRLSLSFWRWISMFRMIWMKWRQALSFHSERRPIRLGLILLALVLPGLAMDNCTNVTDVEKIGPGMHICALNITGDLNLTLANLTNVTLDAIIASGKVNRRS